MADVLQFPSQTQTSYKAVDDNLARRQALDTRASCIVEAPAGSGKTGLMVQRYLKLLGDETVESPEEVLAITFTNKATAELRDRILEQLRNASDGPLPAYAAAFDQDTRALAKSALTRSSLLGWSLVERPFRLNIRSIDSVCSEIVNSLPLLAGGFGKRQPLEDPGPIYRLAARRTLLQLGGVDSVLHQSIRTVLLHRDGSLLDCEKLLAEMLEAREQWGELVPLSQAEVDDAHLDQVIRGTLERSLENIVCAGLSRALRAIPAELLHELTNLATQLSIHPPYKLDVSPISICRDRHDPPETAAKHLDHWRALISLVMKKDGLWRKRCSRADIGFEIPKPHQLHLERLITSMQSDTLLDALCAVRALPPARYPDNQWLVTKALFHVLRHALAELRLLFAERGECDFAELALVARSALRAEDGASDAALAAGGRLRHLLVDEMQDTSSGQYELIDLLTRSWDGSTQTLFLVGDPKQSIYLFRQARVERFLRTMEEQRLGEITLKPLQLTSNFRSQANLVNDFNRSFNLLFPLPDAAHTASNEGADVPFVEANPVREQSTERGIVWHPAILSEERTQQDYTCQEARTIRRIVELRLAMPLPQERSDPLNPKPWRIAVLGRARSHLTAVITEFKRDRGNGPIAFRGIDLDPLDRLIEVLDALALTRAILHPGDRIAWLAVLRAPWCGLSKADLLALTGEGDAADPLASIASLVRRRRNHLTHAGRQLLDRIWPILELAIATFGRTTLATHVERTWRSLGGDVGLSQEQRNNVKRYFNLVRDVEGEGRLDLSILSSRLKRLYAEPQSAAPVDGILPVELLTIHKAKGLEWDMVLVPGLERGGGRSSSPLLNWLEFDDVSPIERQASIVLAPIWQRGSDPDQLSSWLSSVRRRREQAERKRVFYVAATRAREEVHLFGAASTTAKGELSPGHWDSLLKACWAVAAPHFHVSDAVPLVDASRMLRYDEPSSEIDGQYISLAAAADEVPGLQRVPEVLKRLPLSFDPSARFRTDTARRLPYSEAKVLNVSPTFERPDGSFAARAFGNVVHRYLEWIAARLQAHATCDQLLVELPSWRSRLTASLRNEGLAPKLAAREAPRAEEALQKTLRDPIGQWLLSPHTSAASERSLVVASNTTFRVDRTFIAGAHPVSLGHDCIWIVDFKTSEQGSRTNVAFEDAELAKYREQLEAYAKVRRTLSDGHLRIHLGLFYPLIPRLIHWQSRATINRSQP